MVETRVKYSRLILSGKCEATTLFLVGMPYRAGSNVTFSWRGQSASSAAPFFSDKPFPGIGTLFTQEHFPGEFLFICVVA